MRMEKEAIQKEKRKGEERKRMEKQTTMRNQIKAEKENRGKSNKK